MRCRIVADDFGHYLCMEEGRTIPQGYHLSGDGRWWESKEAAQEWTWSELEFWESLG